MHKQNGDIKINKLQKEKLNKAIAKMLGYGLYSSRCYKCGNLLYYRLSNDADDVEETRCPKCGYVCQMWKLWDNTYE